MVHRADEGNVDLRSAQGTGGGERCGVGLSRVFGVPMG